MSSVPPPSSASNPRLPQAGEVIAGKYRVERVLGQGGMGIVYAAQHELLGQRVAIKLLLTEGAAHREASARFSNEARAAARIQHENIARVVDVGTLETGVPYMVMEFLEGSDLSQLLEAKGALPVQTAVDYLLQALEAVAQAHALGIVHRDLKPANLFLAHRIDGSSIVKVLDFGISKTNEPLSGGAKTSTQSLLGSPYYMSPEQLRSSKSVDHRADLWSVGVILYELLTRRLPFDGESIGELFAAILEQTPVAPSALRPDVPPQLSQVVLRCLSRKPDERYSSAGELAVALGPFASPRGTPSIERICGLAPRMSLPGGAITGGGGVAPGGAITGGGGGVSPTVLHTTTPGQTSANWHQSGATTGGTSTPKSSNAGAIFGVLVVAAALAGGAVFAVIRFTGHAAAAASVVPEPTAAPLSVQTAAASTRPQTPAPQATVEAATAPTASTIASASAQPAVNSVPTQKHFQTTPKQPPATYTPPPVAPAYDPTKDSRR